MALVALLVKALMDAYLATRSGFLLCATGDNPTLVASLAKDSGKVKILGLAIANALVALSGCIMCQYQRYFDISMGTGTLVLAVASVIVGTQLLRGLRFLRATTAVVLGSILYKGCVALALSSVSPVDLNSSRGAAVRHHRRGRSSKEANVMLELRNIVKVYQGGTVNETCLFNDFSLSIPERQFVCVVGSNGSGKTSLLNIICGSIPIDEGKILIGNEDITHMPEHRRHRRIGRVYQDPARGTCPLDDHSGEYVHGRQQGQAVQPHALRQPQKDGGIPRHARPARPRPGG